MTNRSRGLGWVVLCLLQQLWGGLNADPHLYRWGDRRKLFPSVLTTSAGPGFELASIAALPSHSHFKIQSAAGIDSLNHSAGSVVVVATRHGLLSRVARGAARHRSQVGAPIKPGTQRARRPACVPSVKCAKCSGSVREACLRANHATVTIYYTSSLDQISRGFCGIGQSCHTG